MTKFTTTIILLITSLVCLSNARDESSTVSFFAHDVRDESSTFPFVVNQARDESRAYGRVLWSGLNDPELLLECGGSSRNAFNGWAIDPFLVFDEVVFTDESIGFYIEKGGDYTVSLTRKIESMANYPLLDLALNVSAVENCTVHHIDLYASADGRNWKAVPIDQNNYRAAISNADKSLKFLRFSINVSFGSHGYLECSYFRLEGEREPVIEERPVPLAEENPFFVFCFNRSVSIETQTELPYEVFFYNLAGQVVYSEKNTGSTRIEHDLPEGNYIITVVQEGEIRHTKKVVL